MRCIYRSKLREKVENIFKSKEFNSVLAAGLLASASLAHAGATFKVGDDGSISLGFGLRTSFDALEDGAPDGTSYSKNFQVDNLRLYLDGQYNKYIGATFNTERTGGTVAAGGDGIRVMDAIARFEFDPSFNLWLGRMLPPSDRSNLDGPFYILPWSYPGVVSNYPGLAVGRDDGVTIWGKPSSMFVYSVGAFNGHNRGGDSNQSDKLLYAGRLAVNFWDPEPAPAYYTGSTYYGSKDIFTLGLVAQHQSDGVGTLAKPGSYTAYNADLLIEKKLDAGVPTFEAAYYKYDLGAVDCGTGEPGSAPCVGSDNSGGQVAGKAYLVSGGFLFPAKVGWGQFQPFIRYQKFDRDLSDTTNKATDFGVNYIISGPNVKLSGVFTKLEDDSLAPAVQSSKQFILGAQLQY